MRISDWSSDVCSSDLTTGLFHELEAGLRRGALDAAIAPEPDNAQLDPLWQPFCREPIIVIAKADVPGATDEELLATNQLIRFRRVAWGFGRLTDRELTRRALETRSHLTVNYLEAISQEESGGVNEWSANGRYG